MSQPHAHTCMASQMQVKLIILSRIQISTQICTISISNYLICLCHEQQAEVEAGPSQP
jgi:hypothetical protein